MALIVFELSGHAPAPYLVDDKDDTRDDVEDFRYHLGKIAFKIRAECKIIMQIHGCTSGSGKGSVVLLQAHAWLARKKLRSILRKVDSEIFHFCNSSKKKARLCFQVPKRWSFLPIIWKRPKGAQCPEKKTFK